MIAAIRLIPLLPRVAKLVLIGGTLAVAALSAGLAALRNTDAEPGKRVAPREPTKPKK